MSSVTAIWMLTAVISAAPNHGWHENYTAALNAAKGDRKPLLVVFHDSRQSQQAIRHTNQASPLLDNYHLCKIDVSTDTGRRVATAFKATSYPYAVITDRSAKKIVFRKAGSFTDAEWSETLADYRRGTSPVTLAAYSPPATSTPPQSFGAPAIFGGPSGFGSSPSFNGANCST